MGAMALTPLALWFLNSLDKNTNLAFKDHMVIRMPKFCLILPLVVLLVFGCFSLFAYLAGEFGAATFFAIFAITLQYLSLLYVNCRLEVHKETFTYRTVFRRVYTFSKKEVISIKDIGGGIYKMKVSKKTFFFDIDAPGMRYFIFQFPKKIRE